MKVLWRVLNWLSSLKVAILLLFFIALASAIGTFIPQGDQSDNYINNYAKHPWLGLINGHLILRMQLDHVYSSYWFLFLLSWLGIALMICSWRRQWPTLKAAMKWIDYDQSTQIKKLAISEEVIVQDSGLAIKKLHNQLISSGWDVQADSNRIAARKGVIGRFGPPLVHFGLIFLMIGATLGALEGQRVEKFLEPGKSIDLISPDGINKLKIKLKDFQILRLPNGQPEQFLSKVELSDGSNQQPISREISVNHPLRFQGLTIYQADWALSGINMQFGNSPKLQLPLKAIPELGEQVWGISLPDLDNAGKSILLTISSETGPARVYSQEGKSIAEITPGGNKEIINGLETQVIEVLQSSGILIKYDPGVPLVYIGFAITLIGSLISIISTKMLWALWEEENGLLFIGGLSNRNLSGFANDFPTLLKVIKSS